MNKLNRNLALNLYKFLKFNKYDKDIYGYDIYGSFNFLLLSTSESPPETSMYGKFMELYFTVLVNRDLDCLRHNFYYRNFDYEFNTLPISIIRTVDEWSGITILMSVNLNDRRWMFDTDFEDMRVMENIYGLNEVVEYHYDKIITKLKYIDMILNCGLDIK